MRISDWSSDVCSSDLGSNTDVPAGDIGVGAREVGYMAGMMKKLSNNASCVFTGKGLAFGGSLMRPEATGYGTVYFAQEMLERHGMGFPDARVSLSGSGNVAQYAAVQSMELGARVVTLSDSEVHLVLEQGLSDSQLAARLWWKNDNPVRRYLGIEPRREE